MYGMSPTYDQGMEPVPLSGNGKVSIVRRTQIGTGTSEMVAPKGAQSVTIRTIGMGTDGSPGNPSTSGAGGTGGDFALHQEAIKPGQKISMSVTSAGSTASIDGTVVVRAKSGTSGVASQGQIIRRGGSSGQPGQDGGAAGQNGFSNTGGGGGGGSGGDLTSEGAGLAGDGGAGGRDFRVPGASGSFPGGGGGGGGKGDSQNPSIPGGVGAGGLIVTEIIVVL